jgi:quinol monooxygenase YgiN
MIMLVVTFDISEENRLVFEGVMNDLAAATLSGEPDTLLYQLSRDDAAPGVYRLVELYGDQAALDNHMASEWFKRAGGLLRPLLSVRPEIVRHTAVNDSFAIKGLSH